MSAIAHQATCVAIAGRALLIEGEPGIGKTSLALALIDRGAVLVGDDGVLLEACDDVLWATPHPNTRGMIEVRNVGILPMPCAEAPVALVLALADDAPRHVEVPETVRRGGIAVPSLRFWPGSPIGALRAELALQRHGLTPAPARR